MDGNVKRVLTRVWGYGQDLSVSKHEKALWQMAEEALPTRNLKTAMPCYSQALMDLGATLCMPRKPKCEVCPVQSLCQAYALGTPESFPVKTKKLKRTSEALWLLLAENTQGKVWLEKRPNTGIWASLYSLPVFDSEAALREALGQSVLQVEVMPAFKHVLTHKDLHCHVVKVSLSARRKTAIQASAAGAWWGAADWKALGLPAPVRHLLSNSL
jgi:A/G-specific adenine glycosylase